MKTTASMLHSPCSKCPRRPVLNLLWLRSLVPSIRLSRTPVCAYLLKIRSVHLRINLLAWMFLALPKSLALTSSKEISSNSKTNALFWKSMILSWLIWESTKCYQTVLEESSIVVKSSPSLWRCMDSRVTKNWKLNLILQLNLPSSLWEMDLTTRWKLEVPSRSQKTWHPTLKLPLSMH